MRTHQMIIELKADLSDPCKCCGTCFTTFCMYYETNLASDAKSEKVGLYLLRWLFDRGHVFDEANILSEPNITVYNKWNESVLNELFDFDSYQLDAGAIVNVINVRINNYTQEVHNSQFLQILRNKNIGISFNYQFLDGAEKTINKDIRNDCSYEIITQVQNIIIDISNGKISSDMIDSYINHPNKNNPYSYIEKIMEEEKMNGEKMNNFQSEIVLVNLEGDNGRVSEAKSFSVWYAAKVNEDGTEIDKKENCKTIVNKLLEFGHNFKYYSLCEDSTGKDVSMAPYPYCNLITLRNTKDCKEIDTGIEIKNIRIDSIYKYDDYDGALERNCTSYCNFIYDSLILNGPSSNNCTKIWLNIDSHTMIIGVPYVDYGIMENNGVRFLNKVAQGFTADETNSFVYLNKNIAKEEPDQDDSQLCRIEYTNNNEEETFKDIYMTEEAMKEVAEYSIIDIEMSTKDEKKEFEVLYELPKPEDDINPELHGFLAIVKELVNMGHSFDNAIGKIPNGENKDTYMVTPKILESSNNLIPKINIKNIRLMSCEDYEKHLKAEYQYSLPLDKCINRCIKIITETCDLGEIKRTEKEVLLTSAEADAEIYPNKYNNKYQLCTEFKDGSEDKKDIELTKEQIEKLHKLFFDQKLADAILPESYNRLAVKKGSVVKTEYLRRIYKEDEVEDALSSAFSKIFDGEEYGFRPNAAGKSEYKFYPYAINLVQEEIPFLIPIEFKMEVEYKKETIEYYYSNILEMPNSLLLDILYNFFGKDAVDATLSDRKHGSKKQNLLRFLNGVTKLILSDVWLLTKLIETAYAPIIEIPDMINICPDNITSIILVSDKKEMQIQQKEIDNVLAAKILHRVRERGNSDLKLNIVQTKLSDSDLITGYRYNRTPSATTQSKEIKKRFATGEEFLVCKSYHTDPAVEEGISSNLAAYINGKIYYLKDETGKETYCFNYVEDGILECIKESDACTLIGRCMKDVKKCLYDYTNCPCEIKEKRITESICGVEIIRSINIYADGRCVLQISPNKIKMHYNGAKKEIEAVSMYDACKKIIAGECF